MAIQNVNQNQLFNPAQALFSTQQRLPAQTAATPPVSQQPLFSSGVGSALSGVGAGVSTGTATDVPGALFSTFTAGATGAATGALAGSIVGGVGAVPGAIIGGLVGLATGGVKAWLDVGNSRKKDRALKKLQESAKKEQLRQEALAEKWRRINRLDNLAIAKQNQNQLQLQNKWAGFEQAQKSLFSLANSDQKLSDIMRAQLAGRA